MIGGDILDYRLRYANNDDVDILTNYKLSSILDYADNLKKDEIVRINNYVKDRVPKQLSDYKIIMVDGNIIGCLLVVKYKDGYLLDEIYLEKKYRNKGIGSDIIKNILNNDVSVYLWVYKNNTKAFNLYFKFGFSIVETTETRYFMKWCNS